MGSMKYESMKANLQRKIDPNLNWLSGVSVLKSPFSLDEGSWSMKSTVVCKKKKNTPE